MHGLRTADIEIVHEPAKEPARPSLLNARSALGLVLALAVAWSLSLALNQGGALVNSGGWVQVRRFFGAALQPELSPEFLALTLDAALTTLAFAAGGLALSLVFGGIGGLLASEVWWRTVRPGTSRAPWLAARAVLGVPRAAHEYVWALFFVSIIGLDPLTAILAIAIPYGAIEAKVFSEILDDAPRRPFDALVNGGAGPLKAFLYGLLPQAFPDLLAYTFYRFECAIRSAAVLGIIGAGGLGYQIFLSLQTLRYEQIWTLFAALFALNGAADFWSAQLRRRMGAASRMEMSTCPPEHHPARRRNGDRLFRASAVVALALAAFSFWHLRPDFGLLVAPRTGELLSGVLSDALPPRLGGAEAGALLSAAGQTLTMSILATTGGALVGLVLAFPAATTLFVPGGILDPGAGHGLWRALGLAALVASRAGLLVLRSIPAPIWALVLVFVLFPGILPGAIALGLYTTGVMGRLMAEVTENLDDRPLRALKAQGAAGPQVFLYGLLPSTLVRYLAYGLYRWEVNIRESIVVGLVGAGGLGLILTERVSSFDYAGVAAILVVFFALTLVVDLVSAVARRAFR